MLDGHGYSNVKPDKSFMKDLKLLDRRLDCFFNSEDEIFVITFQRPFGDPVPIAKCAGRDPQSGEFRRPDRRDIEFVASGDLSRKKLTDKLAETAYYMEQHRAMRRKKTREDVRLRTIDERRTLMPRFERAYGHGKANATFRIKSFQKLDFGKKLIHTGDKPSNVFSNEK